MPQGPTVALGDVFVVRETEPALLCRIGDKSQWVARSRLQPGRTVEHPGDFTAERDVEPGGRQSELLPETILPSQFADLLHKTAARPPEHRLMLAVLEDAIRSYQRTLNRSDRRSRRLFRETEEWFTSKDATWPFSFVLICEKLDLDAGYVRAGLHRWGSRHVAIRDGVLDCASHPARDRFSVSGDHEPSGSGAMPGACRPTDAAARICHGMTVEARIGRSSTISLLIVGTPKMSTEGIRLQRSLNRQRG